MLSEPLPTTRPRKPTPVQVEAEGQAFMALMAKAGGDNAPG